MKVLQSCDWLSIIFTVIAPLPLLDSQANINYWQCFHQEQKNTKRRGMYIDATGKTQAGILT